MTIDCRFLATGLTLLSCVAPARRVAAQAPVTPAGRHVTASLVSQTDAVVAGHPLTVGIRLQMQPGWHTYWRNPGDSGLPTRVRWELPPRFAAGELLWPRPARIPTGPLLSFGYEREVVLPVEIRVPATVAGSEVRLAARVDWLECREECLPGNAALSLALPVRARAAPTPQAGLIAAARALLPVTDDRWTFAAKASGDVVVLAIRPPRGVTIASPWFCPLAPHVLEHAKPPQLAKNATGYRLALARDPNGDVPARLQGVLVLHADGVERALAVDAKMGTAPARGD